MRTETLKDNVCLTIILLMATVLFLAPKLLTALPVLWRKERPWIG